MPVKQETVGHIMIIIGYAVAVVSLMAMTMLTFGKM